MDLVNPRRSLAVPLAFEQGEGFYVLEGAHPLVLTLMEQLHNSGVPVKDTMIVTPFKDIIPELNTGVQNIYHKDNRGALDTKSNVWKLNDRVIMTHNNYDIDVMNGSEGVITGVNGKGIEVTFDRNRSTHFFKFVANSDDARPDSDEYWEPEELSTSDLTLGYATSIYKAQGSEKPFVIVYLPDRRNARGTLSSFVNINMTYTGLSRGQRMVWVVCSSAALNHATMTKLPYRYDTLGERLIALKDVELESVFDGKTQVHAPASGTSNGDVLTDYEDVDYGDAEYEAMLASM